LYSVQVLLTLGTILSLDDINNFPLVLLPIAVVLNLCAVWSQWK